MKLRQLILFTCTVAALASAGCSNKTIGYFSKSTQPAYTDNFNAAPVNLATVQTQPEPRFTASVDNEIAIADASNTATRQPFNAERTKVAPAGKVQPVAGNNIDQVKQLHATVKAVSDSESSHLHANIGLAFGIVSLLICWIPIFGAAFGLAGIIFSALGLSAEDGSHKAIAGAGLALSIIGFLIGIIWTLAVISLFAAFS